MRTCCPPPRWSLCPSAFSVMLLAAMLLRSTIADATTFAGYLEPVELGEYAITSSDGRFVYAFNSFEIAQTRRTKCHLVHTYDRKYFFPLSLITSSPMAFSDSGRIMNTIAIFDPLKRLWTLQKTNGKPPPRTSYYSLLVKSGKMYMFGGFIRTDLNTLYVLDLKSFSWAPVEPSNYPIPSPRSFAYMFIHDQVLYIFSGRLALLANPNYLDINDLWKYDEDSNRWEKITYASSVNPESKNSASVYFNRRIYLIGGSLNSPTSSQLWIFNMDAKSWSWKDIGLSFSSQMSLFTTTSSVCAYGPLLSEDDKKSVVRCVEKGSLNVTVFNQTKTCSGFRCLALESPAPRIFGKFEKLMNITIYIGGSRLSRYYYDVWFLNTESFSWVENQNQIEPFPRYLPHFLKYNETSFIMHGGLIPSPEPICINDIWIFNTEAKVWYKEADETICLNIDMDCLINSANSVVSYYNKYLYVIGGTWPTTDPLLHVYYMSYSFETKAWAPFSLDYFGKSIYDPSYLSSSSFATDNNKLWITSGVDYSWKIQPLHILVVDMNNLKASLSITTTSIPPRISSTAVAHENMLYLHTGIVPGYKFYFDIIAYNSVKNAWFVLASPSFVPFSVTLSSITYFGQLVIYYPCPAGKLTPQILLIPTGSNVFTSVGDLNRDHELQTYATVRQGNLDYLMIYGNLNSMSVGMLTANISNYFCGGTKTVAVENIVQVDDGSGIFSYFPGSDCRWVVTGGQWIYLDYLDFNIGAVLSIESLGCPMQSPSQRKATKIIFMNTTHIHVPIMMGSDTLLVHFSVSLNATSAGGFGLTIIKCSTGFIVVNKICQCPPNYSVNYAGLCVKNFQKNDTGDLSDSVMEADDRVSFDTNPLVWGSYLGNSFSIGPFIYFINGLSSQNKNNPQPYMNRGMVYYVHLSDWGNFRLLERTTNGDHPDVRYGACTVATKDQAIMLGGISTSTFSPYIHVFDPKVFAWKRMSLQPFEEIEGFSCLKHGLNIHVVGGAYKNGSISSEHWVYSIQDDAWSLLEVKGAFKPVSYASGAVYNDTFVLFGGRTFGSDTDYLQVYSRKSNEWIFLGSASLSPCIKTSSIDLSIIARSEAVHFSIDSDLYIYAGRQSLNILNSILIVSLETLEVRYFQDYSLLPSTIPWTFPSQRAGASVSVQPNYVIVSGGDVGNGLMGADSWIWEIDSGSWLYASSFLKPIPRWGASFVRIDASHFFMFGGITPYYNGVLLNDLWIYNFEFRKWESVNMARLTTDQPSPRQTALLLPINNTLYLYGGVGRYLRPDSRLWKYATTSRRWYTYTPNNNLLANERPYLRQGILSYVNESILWMFGGLIPFQGMEAENYATLFCLNVAENRLKGIRARGTQPSSRRFGLMTGYNNLLWVFGGKSFGNVELLDLWSFNPVREEWKYLMKIDLIMPSIYGLLPLGNFILMLNTDQNYINSDYWLIDLESSKFQAGSSNRLLKYKRANSLAIMAYNSSVVVYGGQFGSSISDKFLYFQPSFCESQETTRVNGTMKMQKFDDGSGELPYMSNTSCRWLISESTSLKISYCLSDDARLVVHSLNAIPSEILFSKTLLGCNIFEEIYNTFGGFLVEFASMSPGVNGSYGFQVSHIVCPENSVQLNEEVCSCKDGFFESPSSPRCISCEEDRQNEKCKKGVKSSHIESDVKVLLISIPVGLFSLVAAIVTFKTALIYARKIRMQDKKNLRRLLYFPYDQLQIGGPLGVGSIGQVYEGNIRGNRAAIKKIAIKRALPNIDKEIDDIIQILSSLRHPFILLYMGVSITQDFIYVINEHMPHGSLFSWIGSKDRISFKTRLSILMNISQAMHFLHSFQPIIVHGNLTSSNVLLGEGLSAKISDIDLMAPILERKNQKYSKVPWISPEILSGGKATPASDSYSYAIIIWELVAWSRPYSEVEDFRSLVFPIVNEFKRPTVPSNCHYELNIMMERNWAIDPNKRMGFGQVTEVLKKILSEEEENSSKKKEKKSVDANKTKVVVVFIIESLSLLYMEFPTMIGDVLLMLNDLIKKKAKSNSCVVGRTNKNHIVIVFDKPWVAVRFAFDVQHELTVINWPPNFVNSRLLQPSCDGLLRGLRIKMGIALGPSDSLQLSTDVKDTFGGRICSNAQILARLSLGGHILVSSDVHESSIECSELSGMYWTLSEYAKRHQGINAYTVSKDLKDEKENCIQDTFKAKLDDMQVSSPFLVNIKEPDSEQNEGQDKMSTEQYRSYFKERYNGMTCLPLGVLGERRCALLGKVSVALQKVGLVSKSLVVTESTEMMFARVKALSHPNLLQILDVFEESKELHVVWLHPRLRSIREIIDENEEEIEKLNGNQGVIKQILAALDYLHSLDCAVFHPYLSTHTVLVDHAGVCRLIDYWPGAAPSLPIRHNECAMIYWPPEVLSGGDWCASSVVYCLGFIVWELATKRVPFRGYPMAKVMESVLQGGRPPLDGVADERTREVIGLCWHHDAQMRPALPDLHRAISEVSGS